MGNSGSAPTDLLFDPANLEEQSTPHPDIPACRTSKVGYDTSSSRTLLDMFVDAAEKYGKNDCLGWRSSSETGFDKWLTYNEVLERVTNIGYGLRWLDQQPTNDTLIGMFSKNRVEMLMTQIACYQHSMVIVPMYDTLGDEGIEHIVNQTKMEVIICDDEKKVSSLLQWGREKLPNVKTIVHMEAVSEETINKVKEQEWRILPFSEMEAQGGKNPVEKNVCKVNDLCVVCYTSGTTGKPKGVMIEHKGLYHVISCALATFPLQLRDTTVDDFFTTDDAYLSYLPLAHAYEQVMATGLMAKGVRIGFYSGDVKELLNDIKYLRPTFFASVPRLLNRIHDKVVAAASESKVKHTLFKKALKKKEALFRKGIITKSTFWDKLVFKKVQDLLGGRVKAIITGAAPISPPVLRFLRLVFGATVTEGYGQTESSAAMHLTIIGEYSLAEVGPPMPCNMVKLVDVPEMNYYAADNVGEVCGYGVNVFRGYLHDEEKTKDALDSDGWLHTGDIGMWTKRGTLKIIDRRKNIFKLSQGEYVAPEKIENAYISSPLVAQCFIHGESLQSCIVGVVVPDADVLPEHAKSHLGLDTTNMEELCKHAKVKTAIMESMASAAKEFGLKGFEQVKDIHITAEPFSVENNLLTPTFKLKRVECKAMYQDVIQEMYSKM